MKKTKKALLAAIACSAVLAGAAFGFAGCNNDGETTPAHTHSASWNTWTVATKPTKTAPGKATRTCTNDGCNATAADREHELPMLGSSLYVKGDDTATCTAAGTQHYTYNQNGVSVEFDVNTEATGHKYGDYVETTGGHYQVCEYDHAHTTTVEAHDTNGTDGHCSKCDYDPSHEHTYDETTWDKDETGHWHPTTCGHEVKTNGFAAHTYNWVVTTPATADTEGVETGTCTVEGCGYITTRTIAKLPTAVTGGEMEDEATALTAGRYSVVLTGEYYYPGYPQYGMRVSSPYFKITAAEAKAYTITAETEGAYADCFDYGENSYSTVLEEGETLVFNITASEVTNTETGDTVIFTITESEPPVAGTAARPIKVTKAGHFGKAEVGEEEKVFFVIDWQALGGKTLGVTCDSEIELHRVKEDYLTDPSEDNLYGDPAVVYVNGDEFEVSSYPSVYLYATRRRGGDCFVDFEAIYKDGEKEKPFPGKTGSETNAVAGQDDQWFKFEGLTAGQYIIKSTLADDSFAVYTNVDGGSITSGSGIVVFNVTADNTYYIKANGSYNSESTFTVNAVTDADKGTTTTLPIELTAKGDNNLISGNGYYKFTATSDCKVQLTYTGDSSVRFSKYLNENYRYSSGYASETNRLMFEATADTTYYIMTSNESGATGTFNFTYGETSSHSYVITVSDGTAAKFAGVTVKLFNEGANIATAEPVKTGTTDPNGVVTLADIDSSKAYQVVLEGLVIDDNPYGYYLSDLEIPANIDETTNFTAKVASLNHTYSFTVKGLEDAPMEGVKVTLVGGDTGIELSGTSNEQGVVEILALDPKGGSYTVNVEVPESLVGYKYIIAKDTYGDDMPMTVNEYNRENNNITLSKEMTYNLTLTDEAGTALPAGTVVTINGVSGTVGAEGKVSIETVAGVFDIKIDGYKTATKTSTTEANISATCTVSNEVEGSATAADAPAVKLGETPFVGDVSNNKYCKFTAAEAGTYTFAFVANVVPGAPSNDGGVANLTINGGYPEDFYNESYSEDKFTNLEWSGWFASKFTITLAQGDVLVLSVRNSGTFTITKA